MNNEYGLLDKLRAF